MENNNINDLKKIICECQYTNTYKFAWIRAIVEIIKNIQLNNNEKRVKIGFDEISKYIFKYYWNQILKYDWVQNSNIDVQPKIITEIKKTMEKIKLYKELESYNDMNSYFQDEFLIEYQRCIKQINNILTKDVSWRFLYFNKKTYTNIYSYIKGDLFIIMSYDIVSEIKEECDDLFNLIDYRWGLIIESYNQRNKIHKSKMEYIDINMDLLKNLRKNLCFNEVNCTNNEIKDNKSWENIKIIINYDSKYKMVNMKK